MIRKIVFLILPGLLLGACSLHDERSSTRSLERSYARLDEPDRKVSAGPAVALIALPGDVRKVGSVSERQFGDGFVQDIQLPEHDPQNFVQLSVRRAASTLDEPIALEKPSEPSIRAELSARFPNIAMNVVERPQANAYGPFGLAVGSTVDGLRCAYLWQWIDDPMRLQRIPNAMQASLRARICRPGVTLDELAGSIANVRLGPAVPVAVVAPPKTQVKKPHKPAATRSVLAPIASNPPDGAPRYIIPLPATGVADMPAPSIPLPRSFRSTQDAAPPQRSAGVAETRLNLPPEAYNSRKVPGIDASPARLTAADTTSVTGTTR